MLMMVMRMVALVPVSTDEAIRTHHAAAEASRRVLYAMRQLAQDAVDALALSEGHGRRGRRRRGLVEGSAAEALENGQLLGVDALLELVGLDAQQLELADLSLQLVLGTDRLVLLFLVGVLAVGYIQAVDVGGTANIGNHNGGDLAETGGEGGVLDHLPVDRLDGEAHGLLERQVARLDAAEDPAGVDLNAVLDGKRAMARGCRPCDTLRERLAVDLDVGLAADLLALFNI